MRYTEETLKKIRAKMNARRRELMETPVSEIAMCISNGNKKIGKVMNVSLPPLQTCGNCSKCKYECYDVKACIQYSNVLDARVRNHVILLKDRDEYFGRIINRCMRRRLHKYFRWHVAGDILDVDYLARMVEIARMFPDFQFWTYTKMYHIVNAYCATHGGRAAIPANLSIMFSEWRGMPMENPYGFPEFRVVFKDEVEPEGFYCPGNCDVCKKSRRGCIGGETTYCRIH